jgi:hypothetical protein
MVDTAPKQSLRTAGRLKGTNVETLIAVAVAVGVLKAPASVPAKPPATPIACDAAWHRVGCGREKPQARNKTDWPLGY